MLGSCPAILQKVAGSSLVYTLGLLLPLMMEKSPHDPYCGEKKVKILKFFTYIFSYLLCVSFVPQQSILYHHS